MSVDPAPYFLGEHEGELSRLEFQAKAWRDITIELCRDAGIGEGHRVIDLGCGPGFFTFGLASLVGQTGHVLAVDKSEPFLSDMTCCYQVMGTADPRLIEERIANWSDVIDFGSFL